MLECSVRTCSLHFAPQARPPLDFGQMVEGINARIDRLEEGLERGEAVFVSLQ